MTAGEYVSVSAQVDTERADLALERTHLASDPAAEQRETGRNLCTTWPRSPAGTNRRAND